MPEGRMPNFSFQSSVLGCADAFILIVDTSYYREYNTWVEKLSKGFENIPVICWIDRSREKETIKDWKKQTIKDLRRQSKLQNKLQDMKEVETDFKKNSRTSHGLNIYSRSFPIVDYVELVDKIKSNFGDETPIFNLDSTGLPRRYGSSHSNLQPDNLKYQQLFETSIQACVKLQKEKGVNKKVQLNKKQDMTPKPQNFDLFGSDEILKKPTVPSHSFFSGLSKLFSFGNSSKVVKA